MAALSAIYDYPELYQLLFTPGKEEERAVSSWISRYCGNGVRRLIDPACGTGFWLTRIASEFALGVDSNEQMLRWTRKLLSARAACAVLGDMTDLCLPNEQPFDLAINLEGTIGHLSSQQCLQSHLLSMRTLLNNGGHYFLGCPLVNWYVAEQATGIGLDTDWKDVPSGGRARLEMEYATIATGDPEVRRIRYLVTVRDSSVYADTIAGSFALRHYESSFVLKILQATGFQLIDVCYMSLPGFPASPNLYNFGQVTLILKAA